MKIIQCNNIKLHFSILDPEVPEIGNFYDFGSEITQEFRKIIYKYYKTHIAEINPKLKKESFELFNKIKIYKKLAKKRKTEIAQFSNHYFENFTIITSNIVAKQRFFDAVSYWKAIIDIAEQWETDNKNFYIHKGTPYYFASEASLHSADFDSAFMFMGLALQQDKLTTRDWKKSPAYYFLTLDDSIPNQYLKMYVDVFMQFIKLRLDESKNSENYSAARRGNLSYTNFRKKFFDNDKIPEEIKYYFSYTSIKLFYLRKLHKSKVGDDLMAPLFFMQSIGSYSITIETILANKYQRPKKDLYNYITYLNSSLTGWNQTEFENVRKERNKNFTAWLEKHIKADSLFNDFCIVYGLRNYSFHTVESQKILWQNYTRILQAVLNCLFKSIESL